MIHSLEQALQSISHDKSGQDDWDSKVSVKATKSASAIIHHLNKQKFIILGVEETDPDADSSQTGALSKTLREAESVGYGTVEDTTTHNRRKVVLFR